MKRGDLYLLQHGSPTDTKRQRVFVIVSRQETVDNNYSTVICAPVYSNRFGLDTEVNIGIDEGLKHDSAIRCDELVTIYKTRLTNYVGHLPQPKLLELNAALATPLGCIMFTKLWQAPKVMVSPVL
jgi:mRNA interferase MazF